MASGPTGVSERQRHGVEFTPAFLASAAAHPDLAHEKRRGISALHLLPGARVLDVGCGSGTDLPSLLAAVGFHGQIHGVDADHAMLHAAGAIDAPGVVLVRASAQHLPYPDDTFDGVRCDRVLQHVAEPLAVVAEMVRVVRPGGRIYVADTDWSTVTISCLPNRLRLKLIAYFLERMVAHPTSGSRLVEWVSTAPVSDVAVRAVPIVSRRRPPALAQLSAARQSGAIDAADEAEIRDRLEAAEVGGHLVAAVTLFAVEATKAP